MTSSTSTSNLLNFIDPTIEKLEIHNFSTINGHRYQNFYLKSNDRFRLSINCYRNYDDFVIVGGKCSWINLSVGMCRYSITLRYRISILDADGFKCEIREGLSDFGSCENGGDLKIAQNYLSRFLVNDMLTIYCEVEQFYSSEKGIVNHCFLLQEANKGFLCNQIVKDYQSLLEDGKFSDASLIVANGEKQFMVHKAILAARSKVFAAMFENDCEEKRQNRVEITDISAEVCEQMLNYIYTGNIPDLDKYADDLFVAADKYQLDHLKSVCEQYFGTKIDLETAANTLLAADMHNSTVLKTIAIDFIVNNATKVMATEGWKAMTNRPDLLVDLFQKIAIKTNR